MKDWGKIEIWFEVFKNGEVWELHKLDNLLEGRKMCNDITEIPDGISIELVDNGVSDFNEKADLLGLVPVIVR
jgi:hypothetical protein